MMVPMMPVPRSLESLCGVAHHPRVDVPEVPVREVLAAVANAVGGQITEYVAGAVRDDPKMIEGLADASRILDDLVDGYDEIDLSSTRELPWYQLCRAHQK